MVRFVRLALSIALALAAAVCIVRGLARLFFGGAPTTAGGFGGIGAALGYFALGLALLFGAGELFPKPAPVAEPVADKP